jgi:poly-gamma-glutamate capsule biosynthesis protein CapA/YwtB (metallophosphatase superfamily)
VVQRVECYRGKPVLYSIGNFVFDQRTPLESRCVLARLQVDRQGRIRAALLPLAIARCVPGRMTRGQRATFREDLRRLSPGVRLREERGWWVIEQATRGAGEEQE